MKKIFVSIVYLFFVVGCANNEAVNQNDQVVDQKLDLVSLLDSIWVLEQEPIRLRDSIGRVHGFESAEFIKQQEICDRNHQLNEEKITEILESFGWPDGQEIGEQGNLTICNVIQHSDLETRLKYLPLMKEAVKKGDLQPRLLARAEDRIATDQGALQVYGGQIKYYKETKSFDVWPIIDPVNVNKRRAAIGLVSIEEFLDSRRTPLTWDLEKQIKRTEAFRAEMEKEE